MDTLVSVVPITKKVPFRKGVLSESFGKFYYEFREISKVHEV